MGVLRQFRLRAERHAKLMRCVRKSASLRSVQNRTENLRPQDVVIFSTLRNELVRLPYFLDYYRAQGVRHFIMVDNGSTDGSAEYLAQQRDVSLWSSEASYKRASFGIDWLNHLLWLYGSGRWVLVVDVDEFFVYPFCDTRPVTALTDWLESQGRRSFGAMLLDMYPKGPVTAHPYRAGQNPFEIARWFDAGNYSIKRNVAYHDLWIQGGVRQRVIMAHAPEKAPALNKIPLVHWSRKYAYLSSTHMLLPRGLNRVYDESGGEAASGVLLHAKFLDTVIGKAQEEMERREHYAGSREYRAYEDSLRRNQDLWCEWSTEYINWRQLEILGLMSKGDWA
ncbi:MAG: glycosyltransferase family 2 protein [Rhodobacteraceae bacterium]|nr:MAG: glycosyltransferase family 2 protein [Paracoccaceae bacterium]